VTTYELASKVEDDMAARGEIAANDSRAVVRVINYRSIRRLPALVNYQRWSTGGAG
jgi:hypothetical protein